MWLPAEGEPETLTDDDSWAAEVIAAGAKTAEEAYADRRAHVITRWLGADADPAWEARPVVVRPPPARAGSCSCSDGLWNYAETRAPTSAAAAAGEPDDLLDHRPPPGRLRQRRRRQRQHHRRARRPAPNSSRRSKGPAA